MISLTKNSTVCWTTKDLRFTNDQHTQFFTIKNNLILGKEGLKTDDENHIIKKKNRMNFVFFRFSIFDVVVVVVDLYLLNKKKNLLIFFQQQQQP